MQVMVATKTVLEHAIFDTTYFREKMDFFPLTI